MGSLITREIFNDAGCRLIAVASLDFQSGKTKSACRAYGRVEPVAVIVCYRDTCHALDLEGRTVDLDRLRDEVPELDALVK